MSDQFGVLIWGHQKLTSQKQFLILDYFQWMVSIETIAEHVIWENPTLCFSLNLEHYILLRKYVKQNNVWYLSGMMLGAVDEIVAFSSNFLSLPIF